MSAATFTKKSFIIFVMYFLCGRFRLQLYVQKVLCSEGPMFRRFYVQKVFCSEGPIFRRFHVQKVLCSEIFVQKILCLESTGDYLSFPIGYRTLNLRQCRSFNIAKTLYTQWVSKLKISDV